LQHKYSYFNYLDEGRERKPGLISTPKITGDETNETFDDITRKNSLPITIFNNATPTPNRRANMLKPSFRLFIIPLGAVATLASLSAQNVAPRAQRDTGTMVVREQVIDCSTKSAAEVCVIPNDAR
jgi:hypothetical protein